MNRMTTDGSRARRLQRGRGVQRRAPRRDDERALESSRWIRERRWRSRRMWRRCNAATTRSDRAATRAATTVGATTAICTTAAIGAASGAAWSAAARALLHAHEHPLVVGVAPVVDTE